MCSVDLLKHTRTAEEQRAMDVQVKIKTLAQEWHRGEINAKTFARAVYKLTENKEV